MTDAASLSPECFNVADVRTLLLAAQFLAAPEPEPFRQVRPTSADVQRWQDWRDNKTWALGYVESLIA